MPYYLPQQVRFEHPPIVEVALAMQSEAVPGLTTAHFGLFWDRALRDRYPVVQEHPPALSSPDTDESAPFVPQVFFGPANLSRHWYLSKDETRLIQVQQDRLVVNWRRIGDSPYPHYAVLREEFSRVQQAWTNFLRENGFRVLQTLQVEVTYVNHLSANVPWTSNATEQVLADPLAPKWPPHMGRPLDMQLAQVFDVNDLVARGSVTVTLGPAIDRTGRPVRGLNIVFRAPGSPDLEQCLRTMDRGHNQVTNTFAGLTSANWRQRWGQRT